MPLFFFYQVLELLGCVWINFFLCFSFSSTKHNLGQNLNCISSLPSGSDSISLDDRNKFLEQSIYRSELSSACEGKKHFHSRIKQLSYDLYPGVRVSLCTLSESAYAYCCGRIVFKGSHRLDSIYTIWNSYSLKRLCALLWEPHLFHRPSALIPFVVGESFSKVHLWAQVRPDTFGEK